MGRHPCALVLAPTQELAVQVEKEFMESTPFLSTICVYGGVSITAQQRKLWSSVDVAVGTPGHVVDLIERGTLNLKDVRYMVLDESYQMLAVGFEEVVVRILQELPSPRQSMLFSATMPSWVKQLSRKYLSSPLSIDLTSLCLGLPDNVRKYFPELGEHATDAQFALQFLRRTPDIMTSLIDMRHAAHVEENAGVVCLSAATG